jgi:hypothetical protein
MYVIEALHPEGWRRQGRAQVEYWAYQEAQARCCSDGRNYRILNEDSGQIVALVNTSSCKVDRPIPPTPPRAGQDAAGHPSRGVQQAGR